MIDSTFKCCAAILANAPASIKSFLDYYRRSEPYLIALDGVSNKLVNCGVVPDVILGDFDSINERTREFFSSRGVKFVDAFDQSRTDLEKAILYCDGVGFEHIEIYNALGGRSDHSIGNVSFLKKYFNKRRPIRICADEDKIEFVSGDIEIRGEIGSNIGFFGFPHAIVSTKGLSYDMIDYVISVGETESVSNSLANCTATAAISGNCLISYANKINIVG